MVKARKYILAKHFDGFPKRDDLKIVEEDLPPLKDGEFLVEAVYLSIDPYMRAYAGNLQLDTTFIGEQVGKIIESKSKEFPVGKYVVGSFGWRDYTIVSNKPVDYLGFPPPKIVPHLDDLPLSLHLGVLGMPGATSYFGFLEICQPKAGETVVVSGAAGAVGSHVGQIAKLKGCRVIGITGSDEKGKVLVDELGFDAFVNYKKPDFAKQLSELVPKGVDGYFDNVGGEISSTVLNLMNPFGRTSVCGAISTYNAKIGDYPLAPIIQPAVVFKQLKIEGFIFSRWIGRWDEQVKANAQWIREGKLKYKEKVTEGFDKSFDAFTDMLQGGNLGKTIVKIK